MRGQAIQMQWSAEGWGAWDRRAASSKVLRQMQYPGNKGRNIEEDMVPKTGREKQEVMLERSGSAMSFEATTWLLLGLNRVTAEF